MALRTWLTVALTAGVLVGCAPLTTSTEVREAEVEVQRAEDLGLGEINTELPLAQQAPYLFWQAKAYLRKAKETEGYSEFAQASLYAKQAKTFAVNAVNAAQREKREREQHIEKMRRIRESVRPGGQ